MSERTVELKKKYDVFPACDHTHDYTQVRNHDFWWLIAEVERLEEEVQKWQAGVEYKDGKRAASAEAAGVAKGWCPNPYAWNEGPCQCVAHGIAAAIEAKAKETETA